MTESPHYHTILLAMSDNPVASSIQLKTSETTSPQWTRRNDSLPPPSSAYFIDISQMKTLLKNHLTKTNPHTLSPFSLTNALEPDTVTQHICAVLSNDLRNI